MPLYVALIRVISKVVIGYAKKYTKAMVDQHRIHHSWVKEKDISMHILVYGNDRNSVATVGMSYYSIQFI